VPDYSKTSLKARFLAFTGLSRPRAHGIFILVMFTPWIKRKSLKKSSSAKHLIVEGSQPSMIALLSVAGILVAVGIFVVQRSSAATPPVNTPLASPVISPTMTPTMTPGTTN